MDFPRLGFKVKTRREIEFRGNELDGVLLGNRNMVGRGIIIEENAMETNQRETSLV